jgi:hypothetical protein
MKPLERTQRFYSRRGQIFPTILDEAQQGEVIYGGRAINTLLPRYLRTPTSDYDIFTKAPLAEARRVEKKLDRRMGFDAFKVEKANHPGTWRLKSNVDAQVYADYTKQPAHVPYVQRGPFRYATLGWHADHIKNVTLKDKTSEYRHEKDRGTLNRIRLYEKHKGGK